VFVEKPESLYKHSGVVAKSSVVAAMNEDRPDDELPDNWYVSSFLNRTLLVEISWWGNVFPSYSWMMNVFRCATPEPTHVSLRVNVMYNITVQGFFPFRDLPLAPYRCLIDGELYTTTRRAPALPSQRSRVMTKSATEHSSDDLCSLTCLNVIGQIPRLFVTVKILNMDPTLALAQRTTLSFIGSAATLVARPAALQMHVTLTQSKIIVPTVTAEAFDYAGNSMSVHPKYIPHSAELMSPQYQPDQVIVTCPGLDFTFVRQPSHFPGKTDLTQGVITIDPGTIYQPTTFTCSLTTLRSTLRGVFFITLLNLCDVPENWLNSISFSGPDCVPCVTGVCNCKEYHPVTVTLHGDFTRVVYPTLYLNGSIPCDSITSTGNTLVAECNHGSGLLNTLSVQSLSRHYFPVYYNVSYHTVPFINQTKGCADDLLPSAVACSLDDLSAEHGPIEILGRSFGQYGANLSFVALEDAEFPGMEFPCLVLEHDSAFPTQLLRCLRWNGFGIGLTPKFVDANGDVAWGGEIKVNFEPSLAFMCPHAPPGPLCGHGVCMPRRGLCLCPSSLSEGFWDGPSCTQCRSGVYGSTCTSKCPVAGIEPEICAGHGKCRDGVMGDGTCACQLGWASMDCSVRCPGSLAQPCSSHGVCQQSSVTCLCNNSAATGHWTGVNCQHCVYGYFGTTCQLSCPLSEGVVCSGHGNCYGSSTACICDNNWCGSLCNFQGCALCPFGYAGANCDIPCQGGTVQPCSGHGTCRAGKFGDGSCDCYPGYGLLTCEQRCPSNSLQTTCSGHGECILITAECTCDNFYSGLDCGTPCPGLDVNNVCAGHGICKEGAHGNGWCDCRYGYWGRGCDHECVGGVTAPCSNRGVCSSIDGGCACIRDPVYGYWDGPSCSECYNAIPFKGWSGRICNEKCVENAKGLQCSGHGLCGSDLSCRCFSNADNGFWEGEICDVCTSGYFGADCKVECPGGACYPCGGNGVCSDGLSGLGRCACNQDDINGFWAGLACDRCSTDYYGSSCTLRCPRAFGNVCGGHGLCDEGAAGSGTCLCFMDAIHGFWTLTADNLNTTSTAPSVASRNCITCAKYFWGSGCNRACPQVTDGAPGVYCNTPHGTCEDGLLGSGKCLCALGYWGLSCENLCPMDATQLVCGKGGVAASCDAVNGSCACKVGWRVVPSLLFPNSSHVGSCSECLPHHYGPNCTACDCRKDCEDGVDRNGACRCPKGYWGSECQACPGGAANPCRGHGVCDALDGKCVCFYNATHGFWEGEVQLKSS